MFRPGRHRAMTSRAPACRAPRPHAGRPRRSRHAPPKATRRPRHAPSPGIAPEAPRSPRGPHAPHHAVPARGSPRTVGGHPAVRVPAEEAVLWRHLRRHGDVTGEASPIKTERRHCPPLATPSRRPPLPPFRRARLLAHIPSRLAILTYSLGPLEACTVASLPGIARRHRSHCTPRPSPPATAVRCRRFLSAQTSSIHEP
jgi:hypothetical protein